MTLIVRITIIGQIFKLNLFYFFTKYEVKTHRRYTKFSARSQDIEPMIINEIRKFEVDPSKKIARFPLMLEIVG